MADLEQEWLVPGLDGGVARARFCANCAPRGPVGDIACVDCGDGPLLVDAFAAEHPDLFTSAALQEWLDATGWHADRCGRCAPTRTPRAQAQARARAH